MMKLFLKKPFLSLNVNKYNKRPARKLQPGWSPSPQKLKMKKGIEKEVYISPSTNVYSSKTQKSSTIRKLSFTKNNNVIQKKDLSNLSKTDNKIVEEELLVSPYNFPNMHIVKTAGEH
uniref:Uncharacterized protein n=1 Tax=Sipha flava TaxID=143950 RepID=A0A2S2R6S5_9HEMI